MKNVVARTRESEGAKELVTKVCEMRLSLSSCAFFGVLLIVSEFSFELLQLLVLVMFSMCTWVCVRSLCIWQKHNGWKIKGKNLWNKLYISTLHYIRWTFPFHLRNLFSLSHCECMCVCPHHVAQFNFCVQNWEKFRPQNGKGSTKNAPQCFIHWTL